MDKEIEGSVAVDPVEATSAIQRGYDAIANPEKVHEVEIESTPVLEETKTPTEEIPPEPSLDEQVKGLQTQIARLSELEKQIEKRSRDEGGRYGALKQTLEQLQQKVAASPAPGDAAANAADVDEMMKEISEEYPELASSLKGVFSKMLSSKSGAIDPDSVSKLVAEQIKVERKKEFDSALQTVIEKHDDFYTMRETPEFEAWKKSLSARERSMFIRSEDPVYVSEMLDEFKEWRGAQKAVKPPETPAKPAHQKSNARLASAITPTSGTKTPTGELSSKEAIRAGYEKVAGARR
ncbi:MAG: hypothetical protein WC208_13550 [Gallionella sp.]|jgi:hypothetical protein